MALHQMVAENKSPASVAAEPMGIGLGLPQWQLSQRPGFLWIALVPDDWEADNGV